MKVVRILRASLPAVLAGTIGVQIAAADVYTWVDASGVVNISNLTPPTGARVTSVTRESESSATARADAARDALHDAEMRALSERVRQLQDEVDQAAMRAAAPPSYQIVAQPPPMQYAAPYPAEWAAAQYDAQYDTQYGTQYGTYAPAYTCNAWQNCGTWWGAPVFLPTVVVLRPPRFQRPYPAPIHTGYPKMVRPPMPVQPPMMGRAPMPVRPPMRASGDMHRG